MFRQNLPVIAMAPKNELEREKIIKQQKIKTPHSAP